MRAALMVVAVAFAAVLGGPAARAERNATRVLDQTFTCAVTLRGGAYLLGARAHSGTRLQGRWAKLPYASFRTGLAGDDALAWVTSGKPSAMTTVDNDYDTFDVRTYGTVGVRRELCRATSINVPLTSTGLQGGGAAPLGDEFECFAPKQVVVRVRAVLAATGRLRQRDDFLTTHVPVRAAQLAVRTLTGKPLAFAEVVESGKAKLFAARGCTVD